MLSAAPAINRNRGDGPAACRDAETYSVDGLLLIEEVNQQLGLDIRSKNYDTIGGWLYSQVDIPLCLIQSVRLDGYEFTVEEMDHLLRQMKCREGGGEGDNVA